jgi:hypothetical protein
MSEIVSVLNLNPIGALVSVRPDCTGISLPKCSCSYTLYSHAPDVARADAADIVEVQLDDFIPEGTVPLLPVN